MLRTGERARGWAASGRVRADLLCGAEYDGRDGRIVSPALSYVDRIAFLASVKFTTSFSDLTLSFSVLGNPESDAFNLSSPGL